MEFIEIFGYLGSLLVAVSLMMSSIIKLRIINLIGALIFSVYGFIIGALPVGFLNAFIVLVNIYYLYDIFSAEEYFKILKVEPDSEYLKYFIKFHEKDIKNFIPSFEPEISGKWEILFVLRNSIPTGLICLEQLNNRSSFIKLDYVIPGYRDFKAGKFVYNKLLNNSNIKKIFAEPGNKKHSEYLEKMGFKKATLNFKPVYCISAE